MGIAASLITVALLNAAVALDPFKPSVKDQLKLGQRAAAEIRKKEKVLPDDDPRTRLIRRLGTRVLSSIQGKSEPWQFSFDVIESKELNAFALPGGPLFFYTGLIDKLSTEDQVASIIGHEITHVRREHWARAYADQQKRGLGITALLWILNAGGTAYDIASISNELLFSLPNSRRAETEADNGGIDLIVAAGYNPNGMADVFRMFAAQKGAGGTPEFLRTHPTDKRRVADIEKRIASLKKTFPPQTPLPGKMAKATGKTVLSWLPKGAWVDCEH
jgi:predicted Zn-dependent protease